jgi:hypothetical protein
MVKYSATNVAPAQKDQPFSPVKEKASFQNIQVVLKGTKIWSWILAGPETKNGCAGKDQQQPTAQISQSVRS